MQKARGKVIEGNGQSIQWSELYEPDVRTDKKTKQRKKFGDMGEGTYSKGVELLHL